MKNLKQLSEKYNNNLGQLLWGGKDYYRINSDVPISLNSFGGAQGFVLNEEGQVEEFDLNNKVLVKRHYYSDEDWEYPTEEETEYYWDETEPSMWWGLTLDDYYPWPWYPEKQIKGFIVIKHIPLFDLHEYCEVKDDYLIRSKEEFEIAYTIDECLKYPEFFKPIYEI